MSPQDQLEFLISQYLDGTLSAPEQKALEARLSQDPRLRARLDEYARLDDLLRTGLPTPPMDWNDFANQISSSLAMAPSPARTHRLTGAFAAAAALAACALLAIGITLRQTRQTPPTISAVVPSTSPVEEIARADVVGPAAESPAGTSWSQVGLGPPPSDANILADSDAPLVAQPSHVYIVSAMLTADHPTH